jgi:hypothetical protein
MPRVEIAERIGRWPAALKERALRHLPFRDLDGAATARFSARLTHSRCLKLSAVFLAASLQVEYSATPTPPELADRMVALAEIRPGQQVLEPSAGTGRIIDAIRRKAHGYAIIAVELNCNMAHRLRTVDCVDDTRQADFLNCNGDLGTFDRIVMNPPFANADDIKHALLVLQENRPGRAELLPKGP